LLSNPWVGVGLLMILLLGMLVVIRAAASVFALGPEVTRKLAHIGLGLSTLSFPVLFKSTWPVAVLVAATIVVLAAMRWVPAVRDRWGTVVDGVTRRTGGGLYFPIAAGLLFVVANGDPITFGVPILTLTFADAAAALIGVRYGRTSLRSGDESKTLEGSIAFFTIAFLTTYAPLLLFTTIGRLESLLIAVVFGLLVMMLEAVSLRGTDNLMIPFGGYLLLVAFLRKSAPELIAALIVVIVLLAIVLLLRKQRTLSDTAMMAGIVLCFLTWAVGGSRWVIPPLMVFLTYTVFWPRRKLVRQRPHELAAVVSVSSGMVWLLAAFVLRIPDFYFPYTISFAAHMCFIGITWYRLARPRQHLLVSLFLSALTAWFALFIPFLLVERGRSTAGAEAAFALISLLAASAIFMWFVPYERGGQTRWMTHSLIGLAASALGLVMVPAARGIVQ
jgi:phytol kinase